MPARSLRIIFSATSACSVDRRGVEAGQRQPAGLAASRCGSSAQYCATSLFCASTEHALAPPRGRRGLGAVVSRRGRRRSPWRTRDGCRRTRPSQGCALAQRARGASGALSAASHRQLFDVPRIRDALAEAVSPRSIVRSTTDACTCRSRFCHELPPSSRRGPQDAAADVTRWTSSGCCRPCRCRRQTRPTGSADCSAQDRIAEVKTASTTGQALRAARTGCGRDAPRVILPLSNATCPLTIT